MQKICLPAHTPELKKGSKWMIGNIQFNMTLSAIAAMNEMRNAGAMLGDRPDIYARNVKRLVNIALRKEGEQKTLLMAYTNDPKLMDEFTDHIVDVTAADVTRLRELVRDDMQKYTSDAELIAWVETARLLLILAVQHFNTIIARGMDKFHYDYLPLFKSLSMRGVLSAWEKVADSIDTSPERPASDEILGQLQLISAGYAKGTYLKACVALMSHHPFFAGMKVEEDKS